MSDQKIASNPKIIYPKKIWVYGIQPIFILFYSVACREYHICKHFDPAYDVGNRYYDEVTFFTVTRVYDSYEGKRPIVNNSCIGESPAQNLDQCKFNGYLRHDQFCNPCEVKEFKELCGELCETTTGPKFGPYKIWYVTVCFNLTSIWLTDPSSEIRWLEQLVFRQNSYYSSYKTLSKGTAVRLISDDGWGVFFTLIKSWKQNLKSREFKIFSKFHLKIYILCLN